ncbi:TonB-dependent receptor [Fulvivirga sp. M361]|uniref:TonB-dependent receptor n=1 Tax=Fulvivirga sp. M361 TaxID=2594266 RepID=UPI00117AABA1|nr:TonB-dependent receptor [Fulvivirga sp. M361]TRX56210.1 TonB-dependent receptor [Fulvivirga sp. M361]
MKRYYLLLFISAIAIDGYSQKLQGYVLNHQNNPVESAHVLHTKSLEHVHTNYSGRFFMEGVHMGDSLQITHIGFEPMVVVVADLTETIKVRLTEKVIALEEVLISPRIDALNLLAKIDLKTNPVNSSQEILFKVPGLFIGQHAGGGKAEQLFLRGFDIDHGTDVNITVDGMPVNMVSHAHGQGYADLHFVIPETVEDLSFGKGPYYADQGNFATAGFVAFKTKERLENSLVKLEAGQFNTQRFLGMFEVLNNEEQSAYVATEYSLTDGQFDSPQNFSRFNMIAKYAGRISANDKISLSASRFSSQWDASGQVPQRAVETGEISRFGAIDDTEGGETSRTNIVLDYTKNIDNNSYVKNTIFYSQYDFELYSNFTFFLQDPIRGDQIRQKEDRQLFGITSEYNHSLHLGQTDGWIRSGVGLRNDLSENNELSRTVNRITAVDTMQLGNINETNLFGYLDANLKYGKWSVNPGVRVDHFNFNYNDHLLGFYQTQSETKSIVSPKLNILYNPSNRLQLYLKTGKGFHSNDTRVVVANNGREILPAAWGADLGVIWKPMPKLMINTAIWYLFLEQEFVYVGDEGIVEPSGKTRRAGLDLSFIYQPLKWLYWDMDVNYAYARAIDEPENNDFIPLAPDLTLMSGINVIHPTGVYGGARLRYVKDRPANEDNSIVAEGYNVVDMNLGYQWKNMDLSFTIQNVFDTEWNETQFATESRLQNEVEPVEEIHFTPGTPFFMKASLAYTF